MSSGISTSVKVNNMCPLKLAASLVAHVAKSVLPRPQEGIGLNTQIHSDINASFLSVSKVEAMKMKLLPRNILSHSLAQTFIIICLYAGRARGEDPRTSRFEADRAGCLTLVNPFNTATKIAQRRLYFW